MKIPIFLIFLLLLSVSHAEEVKTQPTFGSVEAAVTAAVKAKPADAGAIVAAAIRATPLFAPIIAAAAVKAAPKNAKAITIAALEASHSAGGDFAMAQIIVRSEAMVVSGDGVAKRAIIQAIKEATIYEGLTLPKAALQMKALRDQVIDPLFIERINPTVVSPSQ